MGQGPLGIQHCVLGIGHGHGLLDRRRGWHRPYREADLPPDVSKTSQPPPPSTLGCMSMLVLFETDGLKPNT